ncbi:hypothetical protein C491_13562 [Natronococcus amylolyticus DSM 10524]|uniref:Uncharacterized protein n=1 Tax=Natronococcus amylolyticus DSM 10524 TaxID=1227497 RepID=L9X2Z9_9EURY|nr:hypothetical protein C491_13562 [Natronococcus amylolyticus DSM 10524]
MVASEYIFEDVKVYLCSVFRSFKAVCSWGPKIGWMQRICVCLISVDRIGVETKLFNIGIA